MTPVELPQPGSVRLRDGRRLAYYEFGQDSGPPCLYIPGTPESGVAGACYDHVAKAAGIRWISVDKPGYGHSDFTANRTLEAWCEDVGTLVADLQLRRFAVVGESGGGPHAIAIAHAYPERVTVTALLAAMGPGAEPWVRQGMRPTNVMFYYLARYLPAALRLPLAIMRAASNNTWLMGRLGMTGPDADRAAAADPDYAVRELAVPDAFRTGTRAAAQELAMFAKPWGFELSEVAGQVHLWHGSDDVNVPIKIGRAMAQALPGAVPHFVPGAGHMVGFQHRAAVMQLIADSADKPSLDREITPASAGDEDRSK